ncbi:MAG: aminotransferase [Clostridia bacterium]|nr:aminotransferase [Clostridia bacterium]
MILSEYSKEQLTKFRDEAAAQLAAYKEKGIKLDLTRGKPEKGQLDLTADMMDALTSSSDFKCESGMDCRNYGILDGIPEAKRLFSELLGLPESMILVCGNSSLNLMFDTVARCMLFGVAGGAKPWGQQGEIKFLCPSPGYDRHFAVTETFGIQLIPVTMRADGPDMDEVRALAEKDPSVKGMWCVPKFSNPDGITYSDAVVEALASMKPAADDFRIFWDNAYAVHELYDEDVPLLDIFETAKKYGNEDRIFYFASTSKISFPGAGVAIMAASEKNLAQIRPILGKQTIGFDKINQLRHVRYFKDAAGVRAMMRRHADILRPKFEAVDEILTRELGGLGIAEWTKPKGGYFISLNVQEGCAKRVYDTAKEVGVALTAAGATFPYGKDPLDKNLRLAPSFPPMADLIAATEILCACVRYVAAEKLLAE